MPSLPLRDSILALLREGKSMGISALAASLPPEATKYQIEWALRALRAEGLVELQGTKRGSKYVLAAQAGMPPSPSAPTADLAAMVVAQASGRATLGHIGYGAEAQAAAAKIRVSFEQRAKAPFDPEFLERYIPGESYYLPAEIREELRRLGQTGETAQPAGTHARRVIQQLTLDLAWNSSRLEGNTYSLLETAALLENAERATERTPEETQMILNHKEAIAFLVDQADSAEPGRLVTWTGLTNLHGILMDNLLPAENCGAIRHMPVEIGKSRFLPAQAPQVLEEQLRLIIEKVNAIPDAYEQAFFLLVHIPYLQAFRDGNKRLGRMSVNIPFIAANLCPMGFIGIDRDSLLEAHLSVYEFQDVSILREVFVWSYRESSRRYTAIREDQGAPDAFRMRHFSELREAVTEVVLGGLHGSHASAAIAGRAKSLPVEDQERFRNLVETEVMALHEGNIARFRLALDQFTKWKGHPTQS